MDSLRNLTNEINTTLKIEDEISKIPSSINMTFESNSSKKKKLSSLPELKKKIREKKKVPHFPNKYTKMSEEEIEDFKRKHKAEKIIITSVPNEKKSLKEGDLYNILENSEENRTTNDINNFVPEIPTKYYIDDKNKTDKFFYKKVGKCYFFFGNEDGNPLFIIGPQWYMFFVLSFLVNFIVSIVIYLVSLVDLTIHKFIGIFLLIIFQLCFTITYLINPGYPKNDLGRKYGEPRKNYRMCTKCLFWVEIEKNVNHCYECDICVEGYDHHCPWTSKCIGKNNKYFFYGFMGTVFLILLYFIYSIIVLADYK